MASDYLYTKIENKNIVTKTMMQRYLKSLGVQRGMTLLVLADLSKMGKLIGGAQMVIETLMDSIGFEGTLVVPTFTLDLLDPYCSKDTYDRFDWEEIRNNALPFDRKLSMNENDTFGNQFLKNDCVIRSYHPLYSFAAWGKYAKLICDKHPLHFGLNIDSPLGKVHELNGYILMLGGSFKDCLLFKLAKYTMADAPIKILSAPIENNTKMIWKDLLDYDIDEKGFDQIGQIMEEKSVVRHTMIHQAKCYLFSAREAHRSATSYFHLHNSERRSKTT